MSTRPALRAGELCCTFTCDVRGKGEYRIGLLLKEKTCGENVSFGEAILGTAGWRTRTQRKNRQDRYLAAAAIILLNPLSSVADLTRDPDHARERIYVIVRIAVRAACDMLQTTMATATLSVTNNTDTFDLVVWIYDLNIQANPSQQVVLDGKQLNQGASPLTAQLIEKAGNVSYFWAAEQIVEKIAYGYHGTGVVAPPDAAAVVASGKAPPLDISLTKGGTQLPYMFRPYP